MKIHPALTCVTALAVAALLASCGTTKPAATAPDQPAAQAAPQAVQPAQPTAVAPTGAKMHPLDDPNSALSKRSVFYEFDKSDITPQYRSLVEAHARYLRDNPNARVTVEGNCDERGSREYNVALGQRRSEGVKKAMQLLGARDQQIEAVSFGEEKPKAAGHDEAAWSQNRRSDITYTRRP
ncbi:MAG TPA: peptidoglycan-associated lipoprotein Pal [Burkholderiales bacterium]